LSHFHPNAKSPDVPGGVDIAMAAANVSSVSHVNPCEPDACAMRQQLIVADLQLLRFAGMCLPRSVAYFGTINREKAR
jgi:hypothetical protein